MTDLTVRQVRFHVQRLGAGDRTVVFLHGLVMDNLSSFYFTLAPRVARFANVILYDLRGHGSTERPPSGYSLADMRGDLSEILEGLNVKGSVFLVGHSFGGLLAQAFAFAYPKRTAGMVLIDPLSLERGWGERMAETLRLAPDARAQQIAARFQNWLGRHSHRKITRLAEAAEALVCGTSLVEELRTSPHLQDDELASIECPALMLCGERSDMREAGQRLATLLPCCELRILPSCTHSVMWEATDEVCRQVVEWLEERR
jgi:pimeloyl-ACP methyl ester carboxylesterase